VIIKFFQIFFWLDSTGNAWPMHMATLFDIAGLFNAFPNPMSNVVIVAVNCVLFLAIARQLERERFSSFLSISSGAFLALYILFCYLYFKDGEQSSYKSYKAAISMSFVVAILLLRFLEAEMNALMDSFAVWRRAHGGKFELGALAELPCKKNLTIAAALFAVFALNVSGTVNTYLKPLIGGDIPGVSKEHDVLKMFAESRSHSDADYILNCSASFNQLMSTYNLPFERTFSNSYSMPGWDIVMMKDSFKAGDIYVTDNGYYDIYQFDAKLLLKNDVYRIYELGEESVLFYEYIGDFVKVPVAIRYGKGIAWAKRLAGNRVGFSFISLKPRSVDFYISFYNTADLSAPIKARAFVGGKLIGEFEIFEHCRLDDISLSEGINNITFEIDGDFTNIVVADLRFSKEAPEGVLR
jgi:hypothetical protein